MKKHAPTYHANSIYEVDVNFFKKVGILNIIFDLDNTLTSHKNTIATEEERNLIKSLKMLGHNVFIASNNKQKRVKMYADSIDVQFISSARKPFKKKFVTFIAKNNLDKSKTILIGDQILTDVAVARKVGIRVMLVEKLVKSDQFVTKFTRIIDTIIRNKLRKKQLLINWRDKYDQ